MPAQQRFGAQAVPSPADRLDRLIDQRQFAIGHRLAQKLLNLHLALRPLDHRLIVADEAVAALLLRAEHRKIRVPQQFAAACRLQRVEADAGASRHDVLEISGAYRLAQAFENPLRFGDALACIAQPLEEQHKFIPAQPVQPPAFAQDAPDPFGGRGQQAVAGVVTQRVIDILEPVQIDDHQSDQLVTGE